MLIRSHHEPGNIALTAYTTNQRNLLVWLVIISVRFYKRTNQYNMDIVLFVVGCLHVVIADIADIIHYENYWFIYNDSCFIMACMWYRGPYDNEIRGIQRVEMQLPLHVG